MARVATAKIVKRKAPAIRKNSNASKVLEEKHIGR